RSGRARSRSPRGGPLRAATPTARLRGGAAPPRVRPRPGASAGSRPRARRPAPRAPEVDGADPQDLHAQQQRAPEVAPGVPEAHPGLGGRRPVEVRLDAPHEAPEVLEVE